MFNPVDSVIDGFLDGYGCVQGYYVQAEKDRVVFYCCWSPVRNVLNLTISYFNLFFTVFHTDFRTF